MAHGTCCRCEHVAHALVWSSGGWEGVITFLTSIIHGPLNLVPLLTCCTCSCTVIRGDNVLDEYYTWPTELGAVVNMLHMLSYGHQGVGGCDNVLDEYYTWPTEIAAVVNVLHMLPYGHHGWVGGCDNVLDEYYTWPAELGAAVNMLHMLSYGHQGVGGCDNVLDEYSIVHGPRNLLPL